MTHETMTKELKGNIKAYRSESVIRMVGKKSAVSEQILRNILFVIIVTGTLNRIRLCGDLLCI
jgi:hypothetical protein